MLERGGELLRSFELLASEILHLQGNEHEKIWFDCKNFRAMRIDELQLAARVAAEQVRRTSEPYRFGPMSSRERRIVHLALREEKDLRTESDGEGGQTVGGGVSRELQVGCARRRTPDGEKVE